MFADGSHCSARTGLDVATTTTKPMIYSHSNFAGLWSHPRNITDDQARACAETGGVVGINGVGIFLGPNGSAQRAERLAAMVDHIEYGVDLIGVDHIGVGSDYSFDHVDFNAELRDNPSAFSEAYTAFGPLHWVPPEDTVGLAICSRRGATTPPRSPRSWAAISPASPRRCGRGRSLRGQLARCCTHRSSEWVGRLTDRRTHG